MEIMRQKQELRERQLRMNDSRSKSYKAPYESHFYKKFAQVNEEQPQAFERIKMDKMKQFSDHVKNNFSPNIDEKKRRYFDEQKEK